MDHRFFDFGDLAAGDRYKLLSGAVLPRPIALITTCSSGGQPNAAPFSFFGVLSHDPPVIAVGIEARSDGTPKDTWRNIRDMGHFTVHIPDLALARQVEACAEPVPTDVNELDLAGLETAPGILVASPRILAAPVALECRLRTTLELGPARDIVIGEVVGAFIRREAVNDRLHVDARLVDAIGRLSGRAYVSTRDQFTV